MATLPRRQWQVNHLNCAWTVATPPLPTQTTPLAVHAVGIVEGALERYLNTLLGMSEMSEMHRVVAGSAHEESRRKSQWPREKETLWNNLYGAGEEWEGQALVTC